MVLLSAIIYSVKGIFPQLAIRAKIMAMMQIFVKQPGMDSIKIDAKPTDTIASMKEQLHLQKASMWLGRKFLKNGITLEECGVQSGATINAIQSNKVPAGFASRGQYKSAMKLKRGEIKVSVAHPGLHQQTQSVVMAEGELVRKQVVQSEAKVVTQLDGLTEKIDNQTRPMPDRMAHMELLQGLTKEQLDEAARDHGMEMKGTKVRKARILATELEPQQVEAILNEEQQFRKCKKRPAPQGEAPADVCMTPVTAACSVVEPPNTLIGECPEGVGQCVWYADG
jgi:hypothetical protein